MTDEQPKQPMTEEQKKQYNGEQNDKAADESIPTDFRIRQTINGIGLRIEKLRKELKQLDVDKYSYAVKMTKAGILADSDQGKVVADNLWNYDRDIDDISLKIKQADLEVQEQMVLMAEYQKTTYDAFVVEQMKQIKAKAHAPNGLVVPNK